MEKIQMTINVSAQTAMKIAEILVNEGNAANPIATTEQSAPVSNPPSQPVVPTAVHIAPTVAAPVQAAVPVQQAASINPVQTAPVAQPQTYTIEQIQTACAPLMDAGKQQALVGLLAQFGVQSLPQLPKEQYGAFATALRGLGAKI